MEKRENGGYDITVYGRYGIIVPVNINIHIIDINNHKGRDKIDTMFEENNKREHKNSHKGRDNIDTMFEEKNKRDHNNVFEILPSFYYEEETGHLFEDNPFLLFQLLH